MTEEVNFDPNKHKEVDGGFVPKSAEENTEVAQEMAEAAAPHEDERLAKGLPPYTYQHGRRQRYDTPPTEKHRSKFRARADRDAEQVRIEMGFDNDSIVKMLKKAESDWSFDLDGERIDAANLATTLTDVTKEQRMAIIESINSSIDKMKEIEAEKWRQKNQEIKDTIKKAEERKKAEEEYLKRPEVRKALKEKEDHEQILEAFRNNHGGTASHKGKQGADIVNIDYNGRLEE